MNREIKFRAYATDEKRMCYFETGFGWNDEYGLWYLPCASIKDNSFCDRPIQDNPNIHLMQFTGHLDKNGKEVYEGDVVDYQFNYDDEKLKKKATRYKGFVGWCKAHAAFEISKTPDETHGFVFGAGDFCVLEVIGNIHENPELIQS